MNKSTFPPTHTKIGHFSLIKIHLTLETWADSTGLLAFCVVWQRLSVKLIEHLGIYTVVQFPAFPVLHRNILLGGIFLVERRAHFQQRLGCPRMKVWKSRCGILRRIPQCHLNFTKNKSQLRDRAVFQAQEYVPFSMATAMFKLQPSCRLWPNVWKSFTSGKHPGEQIHKKRMTTKPVSGQCFDELLINIGYEANDTDTCYILFHLFVIFFSDSSPNPLIQISSY